MWYAIIKSIFLVFFFPVLHLKFMLMNLWLTITNQHACDRDSQPFVLSFGNTFHTLSL